jgi:hypothetical protein
VESTPGRDDDANMSKIEDYPGPTEDQPEKEGVGSPADEGIVKPPPTPEEEEKEEQKDDR